MFLERYFPPDIRVEKEARALLKAGHEIFLVCANKDNDLIEKEFQGIKVIYFPIKFKSIKWYFFYLQFLIFFVHPFWKRALEKIIKQYEIQALHIHDLAMVNTGLQAAKKFNIKILADLHENYPEGIITWSKGWKGKIINLIAPKWRWKRLEKYCVNHVNKVITVVDEAKEHYVIDCGVNPESIAVVMNTEEETYFCSLPVKKEIIERYDDYFTISYIGGFGELRGIHTAISAMPKILQEIPNACLLLVGSENNTNSLKKLVKRLNLEETIKFTEWQPFYTIPSYIKASNICLVPHIASVFTDTTIPHKLFQYMSMGKPVIVSSAKPLKRIIEETRAGLVYPSGDSDALAQAVITLYKDKDLAEELGKAGEKAVEKKYNWENESKKLIELYYNLS
jgi:glycosyltransferase involved in cell wall biosynthesis